MTELEKAQLKIEYLEQCIADLELRIQNAISFIEMMMNEKPRTEETK